MAGELLVRRDERGSRVPRRAVPALVFVLFLDSITALVTWLFAWLGEGVEKPGSLFRVDLPLSTGLVQVLLFLAVTPVSTSPVRH